MIKRRPRKPLISSASLMNMAWMRGDPEWPINKAGILKAIHGLFDADTWWIYKGESVRTFEARFAKMHDCAHGVSVCNGTVGIDIALRILGIGPGDRVILPAYDFYSLPKSVLNIGATLRPAILAVLLQRGFAPED